MLFNSFHFAVFFPLVTALYFLAPHAWRWAILVAASCYFYMAFVPAYILILIFVILIDFWAGMIIAKSQGRARKLWLAFSLVANVGVLAFFKYANFLGANFNALAQAIGWNYSIGLLEILLPIGLSFHVFQSMSYTIEVYRGATQPEKHLGYYALYVLFYPQLVAGPIERPQNLMRQFRTPQRFEPGRVTSGLRLILIGLFKKIVIADRLAFAVEHVYADPAGQSGFDLLLATYFFAFQIYCDFSGYSDVARGAARVMGIELMENFNSPYLSRSISEFWRRWHISLSTWFRDYVYVPLGGNRVGMLRRIGNLLIVFLLSGLWHGASWAFVFWGGLHGMYIAMGILTQKVRDGFWSLTRLDRVPLLRPLVQLVITFHLVCFAWIFFRATSWEAAWEVVRGMSNRWALPDFRFVGMEPVELTLLLCALAVMIGIQALRKGRSSEETLGAFPMLPRWCAYVLLTLCILNFGAPAQQFVYFQF